MVGIVFLFANICLASPPLRMGASTEFVDPSRMELLRLREKPPLDSTVWQSLSDSVFTPIQTRDIWLGWKVGRVLLRLPVDAPADGNWWVQVDYPGLDSVRIENAGIVSGWIGDDIVRSQWSSPSHGFYLPVRLSKGRNVLHIQLVGTHGRLGPLICLRPEWTQWKHVENDALRDGILVGILIANLLLALGLYVAARLPAHRWYLFYQAVVIGFIFSYHHHAFALIWPEFLAPNLYDRTALSIVAFGILGMFLLRLLDLEVVFPRAGRWLRWMSYSLLGCAAIQLLHPWFPQVFEILYLGNRIEILEISTYVLAIALAFRRALGGHRTTIFVLLAMSPMAVALGVAVLAEVFHLPWMFAWRGLIVEIGLVLENLALSFLLVRKLLRERREHHELLERHLALELDFSRRLAQEADRNLRGTALDLHDGVGQELAGMSLYLRSVLKPLGKPELTDSVSKEMGRVMDSVRATAQRIYPPELMEGGLKIALERLAARLASTGEIHVTVSGELPVANEQDALHWYRIFQESIHNAQTHGKASRVEIGLYGDHVEIEDDGIGLFQPMTEGMGTRAIRYRADQLGCTVELRNGTKGAILRVART